MTDGAAPGSTSATALIAAVTFLVVLGIGLVVPALPQFARHYGLSSAGVALLLTAFAGGRLVFSVPGGILADRFGFKSVAIVGCCVTGAAASFAAILPAFPLLVAAQFAQGSGSALYTTAALAAVMADVPGERTGRIVALYQGVVIAGMSAAPALGGLALQSMGLRGPFVVYGLSVSAGLVISIWRLPAGRPASSRPQVRRTALIGEMLSHPAAILALVVSFVTFWVLAGIRNTVLPLFAEETLAFGPVATGWLLTGAALANLAVMRHAGVVIDRGRRPVVVIGTLAMGITVGGLALANAPWVLVVFTLGIGVTKAYTGVVPITMIVDVADREVHGAAIGAQRFATGLGLTVGPYTAGLMVDNWGYNVTYVTTAGLILLVALSALRVRETQIASGGS